MTVTSIESSESVIANLSGGMPCNPLACQLLHLSVKHKARPGGPHHVAETPLCHLLPQHCLTLWVLRSSALRNQGSLMYIRRCLGSFWQKMLQYERTYADALQRYDMMCSTPRFAARNGFAGILRYLVLREKAAWDI